MGLEREPLPTSARDTPPLPADAVRALDDGLAALALALDRPARTAIETHLRLLLAWTDAINLTALRDPVAAVTGHVIDSLAGVSHMDGRPADRLLDLGSGGGYPGLPLAVAIPNARVTLLEPIRKKARFLEVVVAATDLGDRVSVTTARAEDLAADPMQRGTLDIVTARAVATMADLVELAFPLLRPGGALLAWKRGDIAAELAAARRAIDALGGGALVVGDVDVPGLAGHRIAIATRTGTVPDAYPRDPAARRRRPWLLP